MDIRLLIKAVTGAFIIPVAISAHRAWPWWTSQKSKRVRYVSGIFILPLVGIASIVTPWWERF